MELVDFIQQAVGVPFRDHGRTFEGWDCWGVVVQAYRNCFGIDMPSYDNISALNSKEAGEIIDKQKELWVKIPINHEKPGDVIVLRHGIWPCHVGLVVKKGFMLHVDMKIDTCVEPYDVALVKNQIIGIYRHVQLAN